MDNFLRSRNLSVFFLLIIVIVAAGLSGFVLFKNVQAASQELGGFAWAARFVPFGNGLGGPGWISFNCLDGGVCSTSNYKVIYDGVTGNMSGYAWSSNIGWIRFDPNIPESPKINLATGNTSGWAQACAVFQSGCSGALRPDYERGGWDGLIQLSGMTNDGGSYGLRFDNASGMFLQGTATNPYFAWGSDVVGWINFCVTPGTVTCVGRVSGGALPLPAPATTTPPGGRREVPPN